MQNAKERPDWAPDNCPDNVIQMIEHEQILENMKLRGLLSGDSKTYHAACERLKWLLRNQEWQGFLRGQKSNRASIAIAGCAGFLIGAAATALAILSV